MVPKPQDTPAVRTRFPGQVIAPPEGKETLELRITVYNLFRTGLRSLAASANIRCRVETPS